jgi:hypothetical protein
VTALGCLLAALFVEPMTFGSGVRLLMLLPLAASVSIVYKTLRCDQLREVPLASLSLWITIVVGMMTIGVALLVFFQLLL